MHFHLRPEMRELEERKEKAIKLMDDSMVSFRSDPIGSPEACIYRIPSGLKRQDEAPYAPCTVSIGPFHHGKDSLKGGEKIKFESLQGLAARVGSNKLRKCIHAACEVEKRARNCYTGEINMNGEEFIHMLVLDGCFIIELLRKNAAEGPIGEDDHIFSEVLFVAFSTP